MGKAIEILNPGHAVSCTHITAKFIRDSGLYTGKKYRNLQMWETIFEFEINNNLYMLHWPDDEQGFRIQGGSDL